MTYFLPFKKYKGYKQVVKLGDKMEYTGLSLLKLEKKDSFDVKTEKEEIVFVILSGKCNITVNGKKYMNLGERKDVFSGKATAVYVPVDSEVNIEESAGFKVEIALAYAKAEKKFEPFVVKPCDIVRNNRGILNYRRDVDDIVVDNAEGKVHRIVVGETFTYPGNWSSYPSHKHDNNNPPLETDMEEIYYFKIKPVEGFGVQVIYNDDLSLRKAYMLKDGDTVLIPEGYHPVAATPGHQLYYLWVMAGDYGRKLIPNDDPKHAWLNNIDPILK